MHLPQQPINRPTAIEATRITQENNLHTVQMK